MIKLWKHNDTGLVDFESLCVCVGAGGGWREGGGMEHRWGRRGDLDLSRIIINGYRSMLVVTQANCHIFLPLWQRDIFIPSNFPWFVQT